MMHSEHWGVMIPCSLSVDNTGAACLSVHVIAAESLFVTGLTSYQHLPKASHAMPFPFGAQQADTSSSEGC